MACRMPSYARYCRICSGVRALTPCWSPPPGANLHQPCHCLHAGRNCAWTTHGIRVISLRRADEPLPFVDDAFDVVWLRHALEVVPQAAAVLRETVRVLAPGGTLVIGGVHPFSAWAPWFYWATRGAGRELHSPIQLMHALRRAGLDVISTRRVGHLWPMAGKYGPRDRALWGGGYVLLARKQRCLVTPLRVVHAPPLRMPASSFSPSARRGTTA